MLSPASFLDFKQVEHHLIFLYKKDVLVFIDPTQDLGANEMFGKAVQVRTYLALSPSY